MGTLNDGYIGSSIRLKRAYKKRPFDFKRKILWYCLENDKSKLLEKEQHYLQMIKPTELGKRYYNLKNVASGGNIVGNFDNEKLIEYKNKLRRSANYGKEHHNARKVVCFDKLYETLKDAISDIGFNPQRRLKTRKCKGFYYFDEGPITEEEIKNQLLNKQKIKEKRIKSLSDYRAIETIQQKIKRSKLTMKTKRKNGFNFYQKVSDSLKSRPGKKVSIDGIIYEKGRIASEILGIKYVTLKARLRSNSFPTWYYLD
jgi:hypothetical protein